MWKKESTVVIVDGESAVLKNILRSLEPCMVGGKVITGKGSSGLSRQGSFAFGDAAAVSSDVDGLRRPSLHQQESFGMSGLEVREQEGEDEEEKIKDPREWIMVVNAFEQPRLVYNVSKKNFDRYVPSLHLSSHPKC